MIFMGKYFQLISHSLKNFFLSELSVRSRPYVVDFETGFHAAVLALIRGWKDGYNDILNTPRIGYERHGKLGGVVGTIIGLANGILKPVVGTLASLTWLCRGLYANVSNASLVDKGTEACTVNALGLNTLSTDINEEQDQAVKTASNVTGFSLEVCRQIISEFDDMKKQNVDYHSDQHKSR